MCYNVKLIMSNEKSNNDENLINTDTSDVTEETEIANKEKLYYVKPSEFKADLKLYYELAIEAEKYAEDDNSPEARKARRKAKKQLDVCGVYLYKIANKYATKGNFSGYTWRDEMISDALVKGSRALVGRKFRIDSTFCPFAYYTTIFHREFTRRIKLEKKVVSTKEAYISEHYKDFIEDCETPVYVRKPFMEDFDSMWDGSKE